jgi:hypothetical protein
MKTNQNSLRLKLLLGTALVGLGGIASPAAAQLVGNNTDVRVPGGGSGLGPNPAILQIDNAVDATTLTVKAETVIAEWDQFDVPTDTVVTVTKDIGLGETTLLNRVIGVTESMILGEISSPDVNFWLINEGGIMFGADSIVSGKSLVFSTLNTTDADFFNFANNALVNGVTDTVRFQGTAGNTITALVGAQFVSDGSLWFVSEGLQLDADFDSANETVAFVTAQEAQVTFTPGSPLKIAVSEGSTLATADISGDIDGGFVAIVASREDMMSGLLSVNADITATGALPTEEGVMLIAGNTGADAVGVTVNGSITSSGLVDITASGDVTLTGDVTGTGIDIGGLGNDPAGAVQTAGLSGTAGVSVDATGSINAGAVAASNGDVILESVADVTTASITAQMGGVINVDSTGGGNLDLGDITSTGGGRVDFDTAGTLTLGDVDIESDLRIGRTNNPSALTLDGDITALSFVYETANAFVSQGITTTDGRIDIDAASIDTNGGNLNATNGRVDLVADGAISTGSITSTGTGSRIDVASEMGGDVTLGRLASEGNITLNTTGALITGSINDGAADDTTVGRLTIGAAAAPGTVTIGGNAAADSVTIESTGDIITEAVRSLLATGDVTLETTLGSIDARAITSGRNANLSAGDSIAFTSVTAGNNADLEALTGLIGGTSVDAGNNAVLDAATLLIVSGAVEAGNLVTATSGDAMSLGSVLADEDSSGVGNVTLTTENMNASLTVTGSTQGVRATINSAGAAALGKVTSTNGAVNIDAVNDITTGTLAATGGNVEVASTMGSITTGSITSDTNALLTADMGSLTSSGAVSAAGNIIASSDGDLTFASATADSDGSGAGNLILSTTTGSVSVAGSSSGFRVDVDSGNAANFGKVTATGGNLDILAANNISTGTLNAGLGNVLITSNDGTIGTGNITAGINAVLSAVGAAGAIDAGLVNAAGNITADAAGTLSLDSAVADSDSSGFGNVTLTTTSGDLTVDGLTRGVRATINSGGAATLDSVITTAGLLDIDAVDDIVTGTLRASLGDIRVTSSDGSITTGDATSDTSILFDADDDITALVVDANNNAALNAGGSVDYTSVAANLNATITAGTGDISGGDVTAGNNATLTAGGMLEAGAVSADGNLTATATGTLMLTSATADADSSGAGNLTLTSTNGPLTVTDASQGVRVEITSGGGATLGDVRSTGGLLNIEAENDISTGDVRATDGNAQLTSITGNITTGDVTSDANNVLITAAGNITTQMVDAGLNATLTGADINYDSVAAGGDATLNATNDIIGGDVSAGNDATLSAGGMIDAETVSAGNDVTATAGGDMELFSAIADNDSSGAGALTLTTTTGSLTVDDASGGVTAIISSGDEASLGDVTSTGGLIDIDAVNAVATGNLDATGGDVRVDSANASIGTDDVSSTANVQMTANSSIDYGSVAAGESATLTATTGDIAGGDLTAGGNATLTAGGMLEAGALTADGNLTATATETLTLTGAIADNDDSGAGNLELTSTNGPLTVMNESRGVTVAITSGGEATLGDVSSTGGLLNIVAENDITTGNVSAAGGNAQLTSNTGNISTGDVTAEENEGMVTTDDTSVLMTAAGNITTQVVDAGRNATLTAGGDIDYSSVAAGADATLAAGGSIEGGSVTTGDLASLTAGTSIVFTDIDAGGNAGLSAGTSIAGGTIMAGGNAALDAGTSILVGDVTAGVDAALNAGTSLEAENVSAGDDLTATATGTLTLTSAIADSDGSGAGNLELTSTNGPLTVMNESRGVTVMIDSGGGAELGDVRSTGGLLTIVAENNILTGDVRATGGNAELTSNTGQIGTGDVTSDDNNVLMTAAGDITTQMVDAGLNATLNGASINYGSVAADNNATLTAGGSITGGSVSAGNDAALSAGMMGSIASTDITAGNNATLTAGQAIGYTSIIAGDNATLDAGTTIAGGSVTADGTITANSQDAMTLGSATADADGDAAGALSLTSANGPLQVTGASSGTSITVESGGSVSLGNAGAALATTEATVGNVSIDAQGDVVVGPVVTPIEINVGTNSAPTNVTFLGTSTAGEAVNVNTAGNLAIGTDAQAGQLNAGTTLLSSSRDIDIADGSLLTATDRVAITVIPDAETVAQDASGVSLGAGATSETGFTLTDAEINRIEADVFVFDANGRDIAFTDTAFDNEVGASSVTFATTGDINITGTLSGVGRLFTFGGSPVTQGNSLADNITLNIEMGAMNFAGADLELRANRILFGSTTFLSDSPVVATAEAAFDPGNLRDADLVEIATNVVGSGGSILYQEPGLNSQDYLFADNLNVVYGEAALFQNSGEFSSNLVSTTGAVIGETLTVNPTEGGVNAFALFGTVADLADNAAALAGPTIVIQQTAEQVQDFSSRINGCIIGTGAGCLNTIIGLTAAEISPEQLDLLSAEEEVLLPFDPLVGTNNEGLFSDVEPECERDEEGACIQ